MITNSVYLDNLLQTLLHCKDNRYAIRQLQGIITKYAAETNFDSAIDTIVFADQYLYPDFRNISYDLLSILDPSRITRNQLSKLLLCKDGVLRLCAARRLFIEYHFNNIYAVELAHCFLDPDSDSLQMAKTFLRENEITPDMIAQLQMVALSDNHTDQIRLGAIFAIGEVRQLKESRVASLEAVINGTSGELKETAILAKLDYRSLK